LYYTLIFNIFIHRKTVEVQDKQAAMQPIKQQTAIHQKSSMTKLQVTNLSTIRYTQ